MTWLLWLGLVVCLLALAALEGLPAPVQRYFRAVLKEGQPLISAVSIEMAGTINALGIRQAAVMGGSAGAPSALQMAIRYPDRVSAMVLLVPLAYKPPTQADSAPPLPPWVENTMMRLIGSDFLFWAALHLARDQRRHPSCCPPPASKSERGSTRCSTTSCPYPFAPRACAATPPWASTLRHRRWSPSGCPR